jgi:hypothetical protein
MGARKGGYRALAAVCAVLLLLGSTPEPSFARTAGLSVSVRQVDSGAQVTLAAAGPLRYSLRHLDSPHRLIVDLAGLGVAASGTQEVNVPPVHTIRVAQGRGFAQVVVLLAGPVQAEAVLQQARQIIGVLPVSDLDVGQQATEAAALPNVELPGQAHAGLNSTLSLVQIRLQARALPPSRRTRLRSLFSSTRRRSTS